jgi:hypothetical protein
LISNRGFASGEYYAPWHTVTSGSRSPAGTLNRAEYLQFYIPASTTFDRIAIRTASTWSGTGTYRLGIYNNSGDKPTTVVLDAGQVSATAGSTTYEITINQTLGEGYYWLVIVPQALPTSGAMPTFGNLNPASPTLVRAANTGVKLNFWAESGVSGTLATAGTLVGQQGEPLLIWLRAA